MDANVARAIRNKKRNEREIFGEEMDVDLEGSIFFNQ